MLRKHRPSPKPNSISRWCVTISCCYVCVKATVNYVIQSLYQKTSSLNNSAVHFISSIKNIEVQRNYKTNTYCLIQKKNWFLCWYNVLSVKMFLRGTKNLDLYLWLLVTWRSQTSKTVIWTFIIGQTLKQNVILGWHWKPYLTTEISNSAKYYLLWFPHLCCQCCPLCCRWPHP